MVEEENDDISDDEEVEDIDHDEANVVCLCYNDVFSRSKTRCDFMSGVSFLVSQCVHVYRQKNQAIHLLTL